MPYTLEGHWKGGPYNSLVHIEWRADGAGIGSFRIPNTPEHPGAGRKGEMQGLLLESGRRFRGTFTDPNLVPPPKSCVFDIRLAPDGKGWMGKITIDGVQSSWTASPVAIRQLVPAAPFRNKDSWERLMKPTACTDEEWRKAAAQKILQESKVADRSQRDGLLCESAPLCVGDEYVERAGVPGRQFHGKNFMTCRAKKGLDVPGCTFSEPSKLADGDPYMDQADRFKAMMAAKRAAAARCAERPAFRPSGAQELPLRNEFLGEIDHTASKAELAKKVEEIRRITRSPSPRREPGAKNFTTTVPKSGVAGMFSYVLDTDPSAAGAAPQDFGRSAIQPAVDDERPPFLPRAASRTGGFFSTFAEVAGQPDAEPAPRRRERPQSAPPRRATKEEGEENKKTALEERPPFRPSSATKRHHLDAAFNKPAPHMPEPVPEPVYNFNVPKSTMHPHGWVPPTVPKTRPVSSVALHSKNVKRSVAARPASASAVRRA